MTESDKKVESTEVAKQSRADSLLDELGPFRVLDKSVDPQAYKAWQAGSSNNSEQQEA